MKYTGISTRASCHVYCIKHEEFSCYRCFISRRPLNYIPCNITRKELYDFIATLTTGYNYNRIDCMHESESIGMINYCTTDIVYM